LGERGIFSGESLWTLANLDEVKSAFLGNPILGSDKFIDKLEQQVSACTPAAKKLAAEALWLLLLFVSESQMGPTSKRDRISRIWTLSDAPLPESPLLSAEALSGIAKPGAAFMTKMPDELGYLLSTLYAAKQLGGTSSAVCSPIPGAWRVGRSSKRKRSQGVPAYAALPVLSSEL